jgi:hypothetical protein
MEDLSHGVVDGARLLRRNNSNQGIDMVKETTNGTTSAYAGNVELLSDAFNTVNGRAKQTFEKSTRLVQEMTDLAKGNVEAIMTSSKLATTNLETLGREAAEYGRRHFEEASAAFQSITAAKSPADLLQLQSNYARSAFGSLLAQSSKFSESLTDLAGLVAAPLANRYVAAAERVKSVAFE